MVFGPETIPIKYSQWLQIHLRLAALEESGSRLSCRFDLSMEPSTQVICRIYFTDDDANSIENVTAEERYEIQRGWIAFATHVMARAFDLADFDRDLNVNLQTQFILHENAGMSSRIVATFREPFVWPRTNR